MIEQRTRRRRGWIGGVGITGISLAEPETDSPVQRVAPGFWKRYQREMRRTVETPPRRPDPSSWNSSGLYAAWLGHSTVLLQLDGFTILTDPVFSERCGIGLGRVTLGLKRLTAPALSVNELPQIDLILLSHAHMDHFDIPSLRRLENPATRVVTARRTADLLRVQWYGGVAELGWGESIRVGPLTIRGLEVNHWGARYRTDVYRGFNGYLIEGAGKRIVFGGDTANTNAFRVVKSSQPVDLALMPIGAYDPWIRYHCNPEEAWRMGEDAGAEHFLPIHHQTFHLSAEPLHEPIERFLTCAGNHLHRVQTRNIGDELAL